MVRNSETQDGPTRRDYLKYSGALVGGGLLAGCSSSGGSDAESTGGDTTSTATGADSPSDTSTATPEVSGHSASIAPVGDVEFESVPEDVFTILTHHAGMALALGHGDAINAMHAPGYYQSLWSRFTHHLDGVSVDWEGLYSSWPPTKEKLFELDSDVHLADPAKVVTAEKWDESDITEVRQNIGPWFGNSLSATHEEAPEQFADKYEYYTLWEIFERVAAVFQEQDRYEALASVHRSILESFEQSLPPESERPSAAMVLFSSQDESMWAYRINQPGYYAAHTRPLGATDALVEAFGSDYGQNENGKIDYEMLLEADPDVLLVLGPMSETHNIEDIRNDLADHAVAKEITAVKEEQVYTQGARTQGPLVNLFQLEMTAKQLYPEQFGEWPGYENGSPYPSIPEEEQLFDRNRVAKVVTDGVDES